MTSPVPFRCGFAAIVGEPNAGKSTLLNAVLGVKISIVTPRPQTTRRRVLGFHTADDHQIVFIDTPGLVDPRYALQRSMMVSISAALADADVICLIADAARVLEERRLPLEMLALVREAGKPAVAVLNKADLVADKRLLLPWIDVLHREHGTAAIHPLSAFSGEGVEEFAAGVAGLLPLSPPLYPPDQLSDEPERFFVAEIIREKIFQQFRQEVPYATEVVISAYTEEEARDHIAADILVERESQRRILIGHGGAAIKAIGIAARRDIEEFIGRHVFLELHVKIREHWRDDENWVRRLGYPL